MQGVLDTDAVLAVAREVITSDTTWLDLWPVLLNTGVVPADKEITAKSLIRRAAYDGRLPKLQPAKRGSKPGTAWSDARREATEWQHYENQRHTDEEPTVLELFHRRERHCERLLRRWLARNASGTLPLTPHLLAELARAGCGDAIVQRVARRMRREGIAVFVWDPVCLRPRELAPEGLTVNAA
jgi:hypothetical protein